MPTRHKWRRKVYWTVKLEFLVLALVAFNAGVCGIPWVSRAILQLGLFLLNLYALIRYVFGSDFSVTRNEPCFSGCKHS
jgi:hypothetical protein